MENAFLFLIRHKKVVFCKTDDFFRTASKDAIYNCSFTGTKFKTILFGNMLERWRRTSSITLSRKLLKAQRTKKVTTHFPNRGNQLVFMIMFSDFLHKLYGYEKLIYLLKQDTSLYVRLEKTHHFLLETLHEFPSRLASITIHSTL